MLARTNAARDRPLLYVDHELVSVMQITTRGEMVQERKKLLGRKFAFELAHFGERFVGALRLGFVDLADGKAHVDQDEVAGTGLGDEVETHLAHDSAEFDPACAGKTQVFTGQDFSRYRQAHGNRSNVESHPEAQIPLSCFGKLPAVMRITWRCD